MSSLLPELVCAEAKRRRRDFFFWTAGEAADADGRTAGGSRAGPRADGTSDRLECGSADFADGDGAAAALDTASDGDGFAGGTAGMEADGRHAAEDDA